MRVLPNTDRSYASLPATWRSAGGGAGFAAAEGLVESPFEEWSGEIAPDGRFIAYQSEESGQSEIYVRIN